MASVNYTHATRTVTAASCVLDLAATPDGNYPVWVSGTGYPNLVRAATHQVVPGGFYGRGFSRFTPGSFNDGARGEHYCGIGQMFGFDAVGDSTRMVVGQLIRFGTTFFADQTDNAAMKNLILINDTGSRPMIIPKWTGTLVLGACDGTTCNTTPDGSVDWHNDNNNQPDITQFLGQWLWVEFQFDSTAPVTRVKTWSQDGRLVGAQTVANWASPGRVTTLDIIGFLNSIPVQGAQPYYDLEMVEFNVGSAADLTPPAGFPGSLRGPTRRNGVEVTPELAGWTKPNATTLRSPDGSIEIGDAAQTEFVPQFKQKEHGGRVSFSLRLSLPDNIANRLETVGNTVVFERGIVKAEFRFETGLPSGRNIDGSLLQFASDRFSFTITLASRPSINSLDFTIGGANTKLDLQPPLTNAEVRDGFVRDPHVINSIAIRTTNGDRDARGSTKIGHLYRPRATGADGNGVWGDWSIVNPTTVRMTIPASFLNSAVYPVVIE